DRRDAEHEQRNGRGRGRSGGGGRGGNGQRSGAPKGGGGKPGSHKPGGHRPFRSGGGGKPFGEAFAEKVFGADGLGGAGKPARPDARSANAAAPGDKKRFRPKRRFGGERAA